MTMRLLAEGLWLPRLTTADRSRLTDDRRPGASGFPLLFGAVGCDPSQKGSPTGQRDADHPRARHDPEHAVVLP